MMTMWRIESFVFFRNWISFLAKGAMVEHIHCFLYSTELPSFLSSVLHLGWSSDDPLSADQKTTTASVFL